MPPWKKVKLGDICLKIGSGATPRGGESSYISQGISLVRSQNVLDYVFSMRGLAYITEKQANELSNVELKENDVLVNITGDSVARVCQIPSFILPARVNQHVAILRSNQTILHPVYLKYYLLHPISKQNLLTYASSGATRNALTKGMLEGFEIQIPDLSTQSRIASILSAFEDKIEINRQMNTTLEQMAQAMFKEYFIKSKEGTLKLSDYIELNPKISISKNSVVKYVEMSDISQSGSSINHFVERSFNSGSKFQRMDTLLARITPCLENGKTGLVDFLEENESGFGSTEFIVMRPKTSISPFYVYFVARDNSFREHAIKSMVGTSGRQRVQTEMLYDFMLNGIETENMIKFHKFSESCFYKIKANCDENKFLVQLRDSLLPKLMNGKLPADSVSLEESPKAIVA